MVSHRGICPSEVSSFLVEVEFLLEHVSAPLVAFPQARFTACVRPKIDALCVSSFVDSLNQRRYRIVQSQLFLPGKPELRSSFFRREIAPRCRQSPPDVEIVHNDRSTPCLLRSKALRPTQGRALPRLRSVSTLEIAVFFTGKIATQTGSLFQASRSYTTIDRLSLLRSKAQRPTQGRAPLLPFAITD